MLTLNDDEKKRGIIAVSSGNHGRAVAYASNLLGMDALICVSTKTPQNKVEGIGSFGAEVRMVEDSYDDAELDARRVAEETGRTFIEGFDDPVVIAGAGTVALEVYEDIPEVTHFLFPVSGGGLASGISIFARANNPKVRLSGVQMDRKPVMYTCLAEGRLLSLPEEPTLAEGLKGGIGFKNQYTMRLCQHYLNEIGLVSEEAIADAMRFLFREHRLVVEGSAAVGVAALLSGRIKPEGKTVVILSGCNVDIPLFLDVMEERPLVLH